MKSLANKLEVLKEFFDWNGSLDVPEISWEVDGIRISNPFVDSTGRELTAEQAIEQYGESTVQDLVEEVIRYKVDSLAQTIAAMYHDLGGNKVINPEDGNRPEWAVLVDAMCRAYDELCTYWTVDTALELMRACNRLRGHESDVIYWLDLNQDVLDLMEVLD